MEQLVSHAKQMDIHLTTQQLTRFHLYSKALTQWNQRANLTAITDTQNIATKHFLDSLTVTLAIPRGILHNASLIDIGTGAGFPGIPLKILFPRMPLALVDSIQKKTDFLHYLIRLLELEHVTICRDRAESLAHKPEFREWYDIVVSRAVAPLPVLIELTMPFVRLGGVAILQKRGTELDPIHKPLEILGGRIETITPIRIHPLQDGRELVVIRKTKSTPPHLPRRPGIPRKRPL